MAYTVSNVIADALTRIGELNIRQATGGSTTTLIDANLPGDFASDDDFKDGFVIVLYDAAGAGAAPEGQMQRISANVISTGVFTVDTAFTVAVAVGDLFGFTSSLFDLPTMRRLLNQALTSLGDVPLIDTSLTTAAAQTEYAIPVALKRKKPFQVDIQIITNDANDNRWQTLYDYEWVPAAAGSTGLIILPDQPPTGRTLRLWYRDKHPVVHVFSDPINEAIAPELAIQTLVYHIRNWQTERDPGSSASLKDKLVKAKNELNEAKLEHSIERPARKPKLLTLGNDAWSDMGEDFSFPGTS